MIFKILSFFIAIFSSIMLIACAPTIMNEELYKKSKSLKLQNERKISLIKNTKTYLEDIDTSKDGAILIDDSKSALLHRLAFIKMATKSIDIQTYIYKNDLTSKLIVYELHAAAKRGVKIRILTDDNGLDNDFSDIIALDNNPNIDVKIFNPYSIRSKFFRFFEIFDFNRLNRRMHNKLFLFDDVAFIVGGRNISDNYFGNASIDFTDIDVLFLGKVAKQAKNSFEEFWNYKRSIPVNLLPSKKKLEKYIKNKSKNKPLKKDLLSSYAKDLNLFLDRYKNKELKVYYGDASYIADPPSKIDTSPTFVDSLILYRLNYNLNLAKKDILISSAYLVPGAYNVSFWSMLIEKGVKLKILTNSLASIDVVPVYSSWERYRNQLSYAGALIYEYKNLYKAKLTNKLLKPSTKKKYLSLHSKSIIIDDLVSVGSFNLDYRSALLNTENMVFFKSKEFSLLLKDTINNQMENSWQVTCSPHRIFNKCKWSEAKAFKEDTKDKEVYKKPPNTSFWLRFYKNIAKIIPEKLL